MTNMIDLSKPNLGGEGHKQRIKTEWWWMNIYEHPPPFCETKHHSNKSFNAAVISLHNRIIKQFKTVCGNSLRLGCCVKKQNLPMKHTNTSKTIIKRKQSRGVPKMSKSTIFDLNVSSGWGGHISISFPEAFAFPPLKCLKSGVTSHYPWFLQQCHCLSSSFEESLIIRKKIKAPENRFLK